jgi:hypothetical protein
MDVAGVTVKLILLLVAGFKVRHRPGRLDVITSEI